MKVGILTQPLKNNYGGLLQNYALQQVLLRGGHEVETIDQDRPRCPSLRDWAYKRKMEILHALKPKQYVKPRYTLNSEERAVISKNTDHFINAYIRRTQPVCSTEEFMETSIHQGYEALVVGSDQCWRPKYNPFLYDMFLSFSEGRNDIRRIAYAASFGTDEWEFSNEQTEVCSKLAQRFDLITVREKSGVDMCQEHLGVKASHVLDPTMLLKKEDYVHLILQEKEQKSAGSLFHYILDPSTEKQALIEMIADQTGLQPFTVMPRYQAENRSKWDVKNHINECVFPNVTSWIRGFMDAEMVVVDSFHGAVFSIIFNKPFWVIGNKKRGMTRFMSLLQMFKIEERLITFPELYNNRDYCLPIDWNHINTFRQELALNSKSLLLSALSR